MLRCRRRPAHRGRTDPVRRVEIRAQRTDDYRNREFSGGYAEYGAINILAFACLAHVIARSDPRGLGGAAVLIGPSHGWEPPSEEETSEIPDTYVPMRPLANPIPS